MGTVAAWELRLIRCILPSNSTLDVDHKSQVLGQATHPQSVLGAKLVTPPGYNLGTSPCTGSPVA